MLRIFQGDALEQLRRLWSESVQCCITSPPYWGLRDYGTAQWEGGEDGCDHTELYYEGLNGKETPGGRGGSMPHRERQYKELCPKCGARRIDSQLGLEATPEEYIENMVAVFREVWRVLRDDGTLWVNLGDSYFALGATGGSFTGGKHGEHGLAHVREARDRQLKSARNCGLRPKDLCGIPWRLALALQADGWYLRSDIIWAKPNPMPESVTDRPTKAHEYIFLLTKAERYFYDAEAIREEGSGRIPGNKVHQKIDDSRNDRNSILIAQQKTQDFRNKRTVWTIAEPEHVAKCPIDPAIVAALQADGWEIRVEPKPETVIDQPTRSHEYIFLLTKSAKYFYDAEAIREPAIEPRRQSTFRGGSYCDHSSFNNSDKDITKTPLHSFNLEPRNKRTVWTIATQPYVEAHFATFPEEIPKLCILAGSKPGDTILDPFAGSGTVGKVALELGRRAILIELNPKYVQMIKDRTSVTVGMF